MEHALAERLDTPLLRSAAAAGALVLIVLFCCLCCFTALYEELRAAYDEWITSRYESMLSEDPTYISLKDQALKDQALKEVARKVVKKGGDATPGIKGITAKAAAVVKLKVKKADENVASGCSTAVGTPKGTPMASDRAPLLALGDALSHELDPNVSSALSSAKGTPMASVRDAGESAAREPATPPPPPPPPPPSGGDAEGSSWLGGLFSWQVGRRPSPRVTPHAIPWQGGHGGQPNPTVAAVSSIYRSSAAAGGEWQKAHAKNGDEYWYNELSGETSWTKPSENSARPSQRGRLPSPGRWLGGAGSLWSGMRVSGAPTAAPAPGQLGAVPLAQLQLTGDDAASREMAMDLGLVTIPGLVEPAAEPLLAGHARCPAAMKAQKLRREKDVASGKATPKKSASGTTALRRAPPCAVPAVGRSSSKPMAPSPAGSARSVPSIDVDALAPYDEEEEYDAVQGRIANVLGQAPSPHNRLESLPRDRVPPPPPPGRPPPKMVALAPPPTAAHAPAHVPAHVPVRAPEQYNALVPCVPQSPPPPAPLPAPAPAPDFDEFGNPLPTYKYSFTQVRAPLRRNVLLRAKRPVVHIEIPEGIWEADGDEEGDVLPTPLPGSQGRPAAPEESPAGAQSFCRKSSFASEESFIRRPGEVHEPIAEGNKPLVPVAPKERVDMVAAGLGTVGGTPSLMRRPTLTGVASQRAEASHVAASPGSPSSGPAGVPSVRPLPKLGDVKQRMNWGLGEDGGEDDGEDDVEDAEAKAPAPADAAKGGASKLGSGHETPADASPFGVRSPAAFSAGANAGCAPGMDTGTGEGLSALFVHPDEDVYDMAEGGGILAEPPRSFEALAFAPRERKSPEAKRRRAGGQAPTMRSRQERDADGDWGAVLAAAEVTAEAEAEEEEEGEEESADVLTMFAAAASLGVHRAPPRVVRRTAGGEFTWQMWASDDLTEAMGVPADEMLAEAPSADEAGKKDAKSKKDSKAAGPKVVKAAGEAGEAVAPTGETIRTAKDVIADEGFKKMHISYGAVLAHAAASAPQGAAQAGAESAGRGGAVDEDSKKRAVAAGLPVSKGGTKGDAGAKGGSKGSKPKGK